MQHQQYHEKWTTTTEKKNLIPNNKSSERRTENMLVAYESHVLFYHPNRTDCIAFLLLLLLFPFVLLCVEHWYVFVCSFGLFHVLLYMIISLAGISFLFFYFANSTHNYRQRKCQRCTKQKYEKPKGIYLGSARARVRPTAKGQQHTNTHTDTQHHNGAEARRSEITYGQFILFVSMMCGR